jgi:hypothetical protein
MAESSISSATSTSSGRSATGNGSFTEYGLSASMEVITETFHLSFLSLGPRLSIMRRPK